MKCDYCGKEFPDAELHESHDVPTYLWEGNRKGRKNQADKWGRHWLCKPCHDEYEKQVREFLKVQAKKFAKEYFKEVDKNGDTNT